MTYPELAEALRQLKVETGSLACVGCGHEHNCSTHGCAILREAEERLKALPVRCGEPVYILLQDVEDFEPMTKGWYISKDAVWAICKDGFYTDHPENGVLFAYGEIGQTIFLTCEEAEKALKEHADIET